MQIFVSYKTENRPFALNVRESLTTWGYRTWMDLFDIPQGAYWADEIDKGLVTSDAVVGIMTPEALGSRNVKNEWDWAIENGKRLLLLMFQPCARDQISHRYISVNWIDFTSDPDQGFRRLQTTLAQPETIHYPKETIVTPAPTPHQQSNRERLLQKVNDAWIVGVLDKVLQDGKAFRLGLEAAPSAVLKHQDYGDYPMPSTMEIIKIFDDMNRELLILGAPGAGKTILLLQLARDLIQRARGDIHHPIPILLNLASWAAERKPLESWLVDQLWLAYAVPRAVAREWVENEKLLLLLDGLDEVEASHRNACVEAINTFRRQYKSVDLTVCSRIADYEILTEKLDLRGAITLQPLQAAQIEGYLADEDLAGLRQAMTEDTVLQDFARTPFLLNTMSLAYRGLSVVSLKLSPDGDREKARQTHLFENYVERRLSRLPENSRYTPRQTRHYLAWLAKRITENRQTVFYIERLQGTWLQTLRLQIIFEQMAGLTAGIVSGVLGGLVAGLIWGLAGDLLENEAASIIVGMLSGMIAGLFIGMVTGMLVGLVILLGGRKELARLAINPMEAVQIERKKLLPLLAIALLVGMISGSLYGLILLVLGLILGLRWGMSVSESVETRTRPNEGIRRSAAFAVKSGLILGGLGLLVGGFLGGWHSFCWNDTCSLDNVSWAYDWGTRVGAASLGLCAMLTAGLVLGGNPVILHTVLRLLLWWHGDIPRNYADFLDHAASLHLLRKVGGGYMFIHRYLLEYFADLEGD